MGKALLQGLDAQAQVLLQLLLPLAGLQHTVRTVVVIAVGFINVLQGLLNLQEHFSW